MADMTQIKRIQIQGSAPGVDQATAAVGKLADAQEKVVASGARMTTSTAASEKSVLRVGSAFEKMRLSLDETARNLQKFEAGQKLADTALRQGAIDALAHANALDLLRSKYQSASADVHGHTEALGLNRVQMMESIHVVKSLADSLIAGQSPLRAFAVEGGRIGQIFSEGTGSVGSQLKGLASQIGGLAGSFGPAILGFGGLALAVVGGVASWAQYIEAVEKAKVSVAGIGAYAGVSADQIVRLADQFASAGRISDGAARAMAGEFAATGKIGADMFGQLITIAKDYAATTGTDITKAGADLAKAFADPAKGAEEMNEKLGFLDDKTLHYIETLAAQNDRAGAQAALLEAMKPSLDDAANHVTALGYAWNTVTTAATNAYSAMGAAIDRAAGIQSIGDKIKLLEEQRDDNSRTALFGEAPTAPTRDQQDQISELRRNQAALDRAAAEKSRQIEADRQSTQAGKLSRDLTPGFSEYESAVNQKASLEKALSDPTARNRLADVKQAEEADERLTNKIKSMTDANGKFISSETNRIALLKAEADLARDRKDPAKARADASEIDRLKLYGKPLTDAEIAGQTSASGDRAFNRASARKDSFTTGTLPEFEKGTAELQAQTGDVGKAPDVLAKEKAILELTTAAKRDYGTVTDSVRAKIEDEANARANALAALDAAKDKYAALQSAEKAAADAGATLFEGALKGAKGFDAALKGVLQSLEKALLNSALLGSGPLAGLFGTNASVSGQTGGLFGSLFGNALKGGAGLFGSLFSGFHATGGTIGAGQFGVVGENGPELALGGSSGKTIVPLSRGTPGGGGATTINFTHSIDLTGANGDQAIHAAVAAGAQQAVQTSLRLAEQQYPGWMLNYQQRGG